MIKRAFNRLRNDERGNILIILGACMPMLVGAAGLATDTIQWTLWKRQLQRAADSAAIAGVYERNVTPLGATTSVETAVLRDLALNQHAGLLTAAPELGFPEDVTVPDKRSNQVSVTLTMSKRLTFSSFFLKTPPQIIARSTAASVPGAGEYCVIALDDRNVTGAEFGGSTNVDMGECCLISNAVHPNEAFKNTGSGSQVTAGCIAAAGGVQFSNSSNWKVGDYFPYSEPAADPFANVTVPDRTACDKTISFGTQIQADIDRSTAAADDAGKIVCINGGTDIKANLVLGAATYVFNTNGLSDELRMNTNGASLSCVGCTVILTNYDDPANTGNIRLNGGTLNLSAPVAPGPYQGIALYQDRLATDDGKKGANHINGNSTSGVRGVMYTPGRSLLYNGGGGVSDEGKCMQIVAKRVEFTGNSAFKMGSTCADAGLRGHTGGGYLVRLVA